MTTFGEALARERNAACLTQSELAAKLRVTVFSVSRWESAGVTPCKRATLRALRRLLPGLAPAVDELVATRARGRA